MTSTRRKLGFWLTGLSVTAMIVALFVFSGLEEVHTESAGAVSWTVSLVRLDFDWRIIPILVCGLAGVLCLAWPSRKPPVLRG